MSAPVELRRLAAAAVAAAASLEQSHVAHKSGLRLPSGERVLDRVRRLFIHPVAAWIDNGALEGTDIVDLEIDSDEYCLVHWPGTDKCALIYASHAGIGNCPWRIQELKHDDEIRSFMRGLGAWK